MSEEVTVPLIVHDSQDQAGPSNAEAVTVPLIIHRSDDDQAGPSDAEQPRQKPAWRGNWDWQDVQLGLGLVLGVILGSATTAIVTHIWHTHHHPNP